MIGVASRVAAAVRNIIELRSYQVNGKVGVYAAWQQGHKNVVLVKPTGAGKTITMASIISEFIGSVCAIAHRQELVSQISVALARFGIRHRIIGPTSVVRFIVQLHMQEVGTSYYDPSSRCAVAGVDTLVRREKDLSGWCKSVGLWVTDECFPAGTLVDDKPIESIKVGDYVTAFNEKTGEFSKKRVVRLFKNPTPKNMVRLTIGHHVVECTGGHPFWTKRGWINAAELVKTDELLHMQHSVRGTEQRETLSLFENRSPVLQQKMQRYLSGESIIRNNEQDKQNTRVCSDDLEQPDGESRKSGESIFDITSDQTQAYETRRQWEATKRSGTTVDRFVRVTRVCTTSVHKNRVQNGERCVSTGIQSRSGEFQSKTSDRSRRKQSRFDSSSRTRQKKRETANWVGLDNIEIFEPSDSYRYGKSDNGNYVYNIEVEDLHTYIANDIVVHNCHHVLVKNKWGKGCLMFPNALGLGFTATPCRADGYGLGRHADGLFDTMVVGPSLRWMIVEGYLTDYRLFTPPTDMNFAGIEPGASGDYNSKQLRKVAQQSHIVGDVVKHYQKITPNQLGICFAPDIETASEITANFNNAGIPAQLVTGTTPDHLRVEYMRRFKQRQLLMLVNVDLFGEGVDVPAVEVIIMARRTESFALFVQMCGRGARPVYASGYDLKTRDGRLAAIAKGGKPHYTIIDHVGNIARHAVARDCPYTGKLIMDLCHREWSLDRREKRSKADTSDVIPITTCLNEGCFRDYPRIFPACPYCGAKPVPRSRSAPEFVDGDLFELDEAVLQRMRADVARVDQPVSDYRAQLERQGCPALGVLANMKKHSEKQDAQKELRDTIAQWAGWQDAYKRPRSESYRRFYFMFGTDVLSAQALGTDDARKLSERIKERMGE